VKERAGRVCPSDYRYAPSAFDRAPDIGADPLYVVGGLYGNLAALDEVERLAAEEGAQIVFNGDFHWFDAERGWFAEIDARVARHLAIRGNVERLKLRAPPTSERAAAAPIRPRSPKTWCAVRTRY
jgi:hypothetical protein